MTGGKQDNYKKITRQKEIKYDKYHVYIHITIRKQDNYKKINRQKKQNKKNTNVEI